MVEFKVGDEGISCGDRFECVRDTGRNDDKALLWASKEPLSTRIKRTWRSGVHSLDGTTSADDILPIPPEPKWGPLDDTDPIDWITLTGFTGRIRVDRVDTNGVVDCIGNHWPFDHLMKHGRYSNDHGKTWHECRKQLKAGE